MKVLCTVFLSLQFGFEFFWQKNIGTKAALKMFMKLTKGSVQWNPTEVKVHHVLRP